MSNIEQHLLKLYSIRQEKGHMYQHRPQHNTCTIIIDSVNRIDSTGVGNKGLLKANYIPVKPTDTTVVFEV